MIFFKSSPNSKIINKIIYILFIMIMAVFIYYFFKFEITFQKENTEKNSIINNRNKTPQEQVQPTSYDTGYFLKSDEETITNSKGKNELNKDNIVQQKDCIISIPSINLEKNVYTGLDRLKHLEQYELVTATDNMTYKNGGNYIICGHASRLYGHSLNRIKEIKKNDIIYIQTADKIDKYIVNEVYYDNMNHTSEYCLQTEERMLTIISCAKYISKESYIIIHAKLE